MAAQLIPFSFNAVNIRTFTDESQEPWFCASDICTVLGYGNVSDAISKHCREAGIAKRDISSGGQSRSIVFINEGNLYRLIIKSRKPEAQRFESWVCDEVLPTIRKTGRYEGKHAPTLVPVTPVTAFPPASELIQRIHGYFAITSLSLATLLNLDHISLCNLIVQVPCSESFRRTQINQLGDYINGVPTTFYSLSRDAAMLVIDQCSSPDLFTVREAVAKAFDKIAVPFPPDVPGNQPKASAAPGHSVALPVLSEQQAVALAEPLIARDVTEAIHAAAVVLAKRHEPLYRHRLLREAHKGALPCKQFDQLPEVMERLWQEQQVAQIDGVPVSDLQTCHELFTEWLTFTRFAQRCERHERHLAESHLQKWEQKALAFGDDYVRRHDG